MRAFGWSSSANQSVRRAAINAAIAHVNKKKKNGVEQVYKFLFKMNNLHTGKPAGKIFEEICEIATIKINNNIRVISFLVFTQNKIQLL